VKDGVVLGTGHNSPIESGDPTAHAEVNALRMAADALGNYRLDGCTLYVTLEPCAMCCGAMLLSRLQRVVFAAAEPKTGCAGSVLDLFAQSRLNHQTTVQGGVLAQQAALQLQNFFRGKRLAQREAAAPLREDALRTPESSFGQLADYPWAAHYISDLPSLGGLRLHYLDLGPSTGIGIGMRQRVFLCLHPIPGWTYSVRRVVQQLLEQGERVVAPDLIGFGKSDKPKREAFHSMGWHLRCLQELINRLDLQNIVLVVPDASHPLVPALMADPQSHIHGLLVRTESMGGTDKKSLDAPYPDTGHRAAERALAAKRK
jgi:tRNA(adenine34) deaminase